MNGEEEEDGTQTSQLLEALECPLCKERFTEPKLVRCGHTFCLDCLTKHAKRHSNGHINCPLCEMRIELPEKGIPELPTQHFYQDLVKTVHRLESDNKLSRVSCKFCSDNDKTIASVKCVVCQALMCDNCSSNHQHNGVINVVQIHRKQDSLLKEMLPNRDTACALHSPEPLLLYCTVCKTPVCFKCKDDAHSKHEVEDLADAAEPGRNDISEIQSSIKVFLEETAEALQDVEKIRTEHNSSVKSTKQQIEQQIQKLINHLQKQKELLIEELEQKDKDIQARLQTDAKKLESKKACAKSMHVLADNLLKYGTDAEVTSYKTQLEGNWKFLANDKLNRFGQSFRVNVKFFMRDGLPEVLSQDVGQLKVTQTLSPWSARKHTMPFMQPSNEINDPSQLAMRMRHATINDFSLKRSQVFAKFVDSKWNLETYKTFKATGVTVVVWMRIDEEYEQQARASKRISMRSISSPCLTAEVCAYNERGELKYQHRIEKLPDGTMIRIAVADEDRVVMAAYPGAYAASVIGLSKRKASSKKSADMDGIYVAVFEAGNFVCGELRKIPIPDGPGFEFDISTRGTIAIKPATSPDVKVYSTTCEEASTNHGMVGLTVLKVMESPDNCIITISKDREENLVCDQVLQDGSTETQFIFSTQMAAYASCEFKDACFDRNGNILFHLRLGTEDLLYLVSAKDNRREYLSKPEMLHKIDQMGALPDGRLCIFDKTECVLMSLKYI